MKSVAFKAFCTVFGVLAVVALLIFITEPKLRPGYYYEIEVKPATHNNLYTVSSYIWHNTEVKASKHEFGPNFEGVYFNDLAPIIKQHQEWARQAIAKFKEVDSLLAIDVQENTPN